MPDSTERPYHHGDLRRVIIETAVLMLSESRDWRFTMREIARRAGVSHSAPHKHFPDKAALLAEVALYGFEQLTREIQAAMPPRSRNVRKQLLASIQTYFDFGMKNPSLFRLMFSAEAGSADNVHLTARGMAGLDIVVELLDRGQQEGVFKRAPVRGQAAAVWAQVHGLTMLSIEGLLLPQNVGADPYKAVLATLLEGLDASPPSSP